MYVCMWNLPSGLARFFQEHTSTTQIFLWAFHFCQLSFHSGPKNEPTCCTQYWLLHCCRFSTLCPIAHYLKYLESAEKTIKHKNTRRGVPRWAQKGNARNSKRLHRPTTANRLTSVAAAVDVAAAVNVAVAAAAAAIAVVAVAAARLLVLVLSCCRLPLASRRCLWYCSYWYCCCNCRSSWGTAKNYQMILHYFPD